ncbi:lipopolysaccharide-induced tumor necrosis factor-alpha factor isoform X3 [Hippopotamus amphibius kiboko]|uniref:lipopolysaccharide-induced tumor necrosis factor-alpha factor isoform X3 n=1 Tax=Hippopotamus amphibius kiboko TaxID=575201 RepID=UPI0025977419|nr:lipopolysaccharide-induced tumor necrosis factor-alpha factor isoform X3 [Hippopotamus amphibius kiboko]
MKAGLDATPVCLGITADQETRMQCDLLQAMWPQGRSQDLNPAQSHPKGKAAFLPRAHVRRPLPPAPSCSWGDDTHQNEGDSLLSMDHQHPTLHLLKRMSQQRKERGWDKGTDARISCFPAPRPWTAQYHSEPQFPHLSNGNAHSHLAGHCEEANGVNPREVETQKFARGCS